MISIICMHLNTCQCLNKSVYVCIFAVRQEVVVVVVVVVVFAATSCGRRRCSADTAGRPATTCCWPCRTTRPRSCSASGLCSSGSSLASSSISISISISLWSAATTTTTRTVHRLWAAADSLDALVDQVRALPASFLEPLYAEENRFRGHTDAIAYSYTYSTFIHIQHTYIHTYISLHVHPYQWVCLFVCLSDCLCDWGCSWAVQVDSFCRTLTMEQKRDCRERFRFLQFRGPVDLTQPRLELWVVLDHSRCPAPALASAPAPSPSAVTWPDLSWPTVIWPDLTWPVGIAVLLRSSARSGRLIININIRRSSTCVCVHSCPVLHCARSGRPAGGAEEVRPEAAAVRGAHLSGPSPGLPAGQPHQGRRVDQVTWPDLTWLAV